MFSMRCLFAWRKRFLHVFLLSLGFWSCLESALAFSLTEKEPELGRQRILVFAPHPDDEVIGLGGWLSDRQQAGAQVWVIFCTDGEAFPRALRARHNRPALLFRPADYRRLGKTRRFEADRSLEALGIPRENRVFLGYPNGLLWHLACKESLERLVRSSATGQRYGIARFGLKKRSPHAFSRKSFEADLAGIIEQVHPHCIVLPHPRDSNLDHRATADAVIRRLKNTLFRPLLRFYLVHQGSRRNFPRPFGYLPRQGIVDPVGLSAPKRYVLSAATQSRKERAMRAHRSQIRLKDGFLLSFVRREELYWDIPAEVWTRDTGNILAGDFSKY
jgi:LmbE family N-acetylglucosaminyl deacetylase